MMSLRKKSEDIIQANGEITKEEYDNWRYNYPRDDKTQIWAHVPSAGLMDSIIEGMKK